MTNYRNSVLLAIAAMPMSTAAFADADSDVRCAEIAFSLSVQEKDAEAFASMIDEDARFFGNGFGITQGRSSIVEAWSVLFADDAPEMIWRPQVVSVLESGDIALSRGPYRVRTRMDSGETREDWGIFNSVWRLGADGKWSVVFDAGFQATGPLPEDSKTLIDNPSPACTGDE